MLRSILRMFNGASLFAVVIDSEVEPMGRVVAPEVALSKFGRAVVDSLQRFHCLCSGIGRQFFDRVLAQVFVEDAFVEEGRAAVSKVVNRGGEVIMDALAKMQYLVMHVVRVCVRGRHEMHAVVPVHTDDSLAQPFVEDDARTEIFAD